MSNADIARPELKCELDKPRTARFDFNCICKLEELIGVNVIYDASPFARPNAKFIRAMLFCALQDDDPTMTLKYAGELCGEMPDKILPVLVFAQERAMKLLALDAKKKKEPSAETPTS